MANEVQNVTATVFKQFSLKWQEVGKSALMAGITASLTLLMAAISAGRLPNLVELKAAGMVGLTTMIGALARYFLNPTTTVIKGQVDPTPEVLPPNTVVTKDQTVK